MAENGIEKQKRLFLGEVVSDKMGKTIVVQVVRTLKDARFHKIVHCEKKYKVHDEQEQATVGDIVEFYEGRPKSKTKYMYLARIVGKANKFIAADTEQVTL
jgi:small subunit ribosomal protein S17